MHHGRVLNLSRNQLMLFLKSNYLSLITVTVLAGGICCGICLNGKFQVVTYFCKQFFESYISLRENNGFLRIALNSFLKSLLPLGLIFVGGTTLFGTVGVPIFVGIEGFAYGSVVAYLYANFALKGVAFNAVIFLPSTILLILFLIFATRYAMEFSICLARLTFPNSLQGDLFIQFKEYSLKFLLLILGSISAALLDGLTATSMLRFFEF